MILAASCCSLPLRDQFFGDFGLPLQPRQSRLLVHPRPRSLAASRFRMTAMT
jgi:hypothetical protein